MTLLKDASLYILDEPFAHLDNNSKELAMQWALRLTEGKALLVIMHGDEQYRRHFDRIIRLDFRHSPSIHQDLPPDGALNMVLETG